MKVVILTLFVYSHWIIRFDIELHDVISMKEKFIHVFQGRVIKLI